jgi:hypothetical protein
MEESISIKREVFDEGYEDTQGIIERQGEILPQGNLICKDYKNNTPVSYMYFALVQYFQKQNLNFCSLFVPYSLF